MIFIQEILVHARFGYFFDGSLSETAGDTLSNLNKLWCLYIDSY